MPKSSIACNKTYLCVFHVNSQHRQNNTGDMSQTVTCHIENGYLAIPSTVWLVSIHTHQTNVTNHEKHLDRFGKVEL